MKKKLVAILTLCFVLCTAICGLTSCSSDNGTEGLNYMLNEDNASYSVRGIGTAEDNEIVIPKKYKGMPVTKILDFAFSNTPIVSVTIGDSVTYIGSDAFSNCNSLTSITIPNRVTFIAYRTFYNCSSLTSITIPDSVTDIASSALEDCSSLTSIIIGDSVTSIGSSAFKNCSSLTSVIIGDSVTSIVGSAFYNCSSLTSIAIPNSVTFIGDRAFSGCSSLTSVIIPDSVTSIGYYAFNDCPIKIATLPTLAISNMPKSNLEKVIITSGESIGSNAFELCRSLTSITIPDSVTSIGRYAFYGCSSLQTICCEAESQPSGWDSTWNYCCEAQVVWGYKG